MSMESQSSLGDRSKSKSVSSGAGSYEAEAQASRERTPPEQGQRAGRSPQICRTNSVPASFYRDFDSSRPERVSMDSSPSRLSPPQHGRARRGRPADVTDGSSGSSFTDARSGKSSSVGQPMLRHKSMPTRTLTSSEQHTQTRRSTFLPTISFGNFLHGSRKPLLAAAVGHAGMSETFGQFFESDPPEVSAAVRLFKRQGILERFKIAARAAVAKEKQRKKEEGSEMFDVVETVMEQRLGSRVFRRFWDRILPHSYILMPMPLCLHALSQSTSEGSMISMPPQEVMDVEVPRLSLQLSRTQVKLSLETWQFVEEWLQMNHKMASRPVRRLSDAPPNKSYETARSWWTWAVREVVSSISPGSKFSAQLELQRRAGLTAWYTLLLIERGLSIESTKWDFQRSVADLRRSGASVLNRYGRVLRTRASLRASDMMRDPKHCHRAITEIMSRGEEFEDPVSRLRDKYKLGCLRWIEEKEKDLRDLQVALPLRDILLAHVEARRLVLEEVSGQAASGTASHETTGSSEELDEEEGHDGLSDIKDSSPLASSFSNSSFSATAASLMSVQSIQEALEMGINNKGEPGQVRVHIGSITLVLVDEREHAHKDVVIPIDGEEASGQWRGWDFLLGELVRGQLQHLTLVWSRSAPHEEWEVLTAAPEDVFDHADDPVVLPKQKRSRASHRNRRGQADRRSWSGGALPVFLVHVPFDPLTGQPLPGWQGLEVSITSCSVVHCRAPVPSLRDIICRSASSKSSGREVNFLKGLVAPQAQTDGPLRRQPDEGGIMFLFRAASWSQENRPGSAQGIMAMQLCSLRIVEYPPLALELLSFFGGERPGGKPGEGLASAFAPASAALAHSASFSPTQFVQRSVSRIASRSGSQLGLGGTGAQDGLGLAAIREKMRKDRETRQLLREEVVLFELTSGIKNAGADENCKWRILVATGDIQVSVVTPYTTSRFLVQNTFLPGCYQHFERSPLPPGTFPGPRWRAAAALPGSIGAASSAAARALGVDLFAGVVPRGSPPSTSTWESGKAGDEAAGNAISCPWKRLVPQGEEEWFIPDWTPSESIRVHLTTVLSDKLDQELELLFGGSAISV